MIERNSAKYTYRSNDQIDKSTFDYNSSLLYLAHIDILITKHPYYFVCALVECVAACACEAVHEAVHKAMVVYRAGLGAVERYVAPPAEWCNARSCTTSLM